MSPVKDLSPEEKLLKVIQQGKAPDESAGHGKASSPAKAESVAAAKPKPETNEPKAAPIAASAPAPAPATGGKAEDKGTPPTWRPESRPQPTPAVKTEEKGSKPEAPRLKLADETKPMPATTPVAEASVAAFAPEAMPEPGAAARQPFTIRAVNRYLLVAALVLIGVVVADFVTASSSATQAMQVLPGGTGVQSSRIGGTIATLGALESYQLRLAQRNIFLPFAPPPERPTPGAGKVASNPALPPPPPTDLKLLAIAMDANEAESMAIIADLSAKQTYFVKTGQPIGETGITLQKVLSDHVQLKTSKGETSLR